MKKLSNAAIALITALLLIFVIFYSQIKKSPSPSDDILAPSETSITVEGLWECLPHKNIEGPQTAECAFGVAADPIGTHYALDISNLSDIDNFPIGERVRVTGTRVEQNQSNANMWEIYPIDGIIRATSIEKI